MNENNGSFKTIYKIKDSYKNNYLGEKLAAINMLFDFSKEYESVADQQLTLVKAMTALNDLESGIIDSYTYFPFKDSSSPNISLYFDKRTEEEFLSEFNKIIKEGVC